MSLAAIGQSQLVLAQLAVTCALVGLIWVIQLVHYPLFSYVSSKDFADFHLQHTRRISLIVLPLMTLEATLAAFLFWWAPTLFSVLNLGTVLLIFAITFFVSVPIHSKLARGFDLQQIGILVQTNWARTALWTMRPFLVVMMW